MSRPGLSVIVPAFDEASHLAENLRRLLTCLDESGRRVEVILVDDGSRDGTGDIARQVAATDARVRVLAHDRNRGKGRALATGTRVAREDILVLLDADLEIPPQDILPLVEQLERTGADVAVGSKYHPLASLRWPLYRRVLSRAYHLVTAILFRLPLRDTQTGLKAIRREVADAIVPHLRSRRFAWDLELLLLAHRSGRRFVTGPVHVRPAARASRVGWGGALQAGFDTLRIFFRDRALAGYRLHARRAARRPTRLIVSGDDLGMSRGVNAGIVRGAAAGGLTAVSALAHGAATDAGLADLRRHAPRVDVGLHLDLLGAGGWRRFGLRSLGGGPGAAELARAVRTQVAALRDAGVRVSHLDAHWHAWLLPWVRRRICREAARIGVPAARSLRPLGPVFGGGLAEGLKRLVLLGAATASAGAARSAGLRAPDGHVDVGEAVRWTRAGRLPRYVRGRTVEVIAHPALGPDDVPSHEAGTLDRQADARAVLDPPLAAALARLGARVVDFRTLDPREEPPWRSQSYSAGSGS